MLEYRAHQHTVHALNNIAHLTHSSVPLLEETLKHCPKMMSSQSCNLPLLLCVSSRPPVGHVGLYRHLPPAAGQRVLQLRPERHRLQRAEPGQSAQLRRGQRHQEDHGDQHLPVHAPQPRQLHQRAGHDDCHRGRLPLQQGEPPDHWVALRHTGDTRGRLFDLAL